MLTHSNLLIGAYADDTLVGIARCLTDFAYCCYLSDLAVDQAYQLKGIGMGLRQNIKNNLKPRCKVILLSAPAAMDYYPKIGYIHQDRCFTTLADDALLSAPSVPLDHQD